MRRTVMFNVPSDMPFPSYLGGASRLQNDRSSVYEQRYKVEFDTFVETDLYLCDSIHIYDLSSVVY